MTVYQWESHKALGPHESFFLTSHTIVKCPADDVCLHVRWTKMDCRVYWLFLYKGNMILPPKNMEISSSGAAWMSTSVGDWSRARIHPWPESPDHGGYMSDSLNSIYLKMVASFPSLTFFTNVIAQTSAKAQRTWLSAVWKHICARVYVYLDRRRYGSTGRSKIQLAIIFGLYSLQAVLQDASQRLISWLFFVFQGVHLLYELLDLIYNTAQYDCDIQSS